MSRKLLTKLRAAGLSLAVFSSLTATSTAQAEAGGFNVGGGGGAAVCRDRDGKIISAHLLDLFEGEYRYKYPIIRSEAPEVLQLEAAFQRTPVQFLGPVFREYTISVISSAQFLPPGIAFAPTTDLGSMYGVMIPEGGNCKIEPVGVYEYDGTLKIARGVYLALSKTDRAAFFLHEAVYRFAREQARETDSLWSRWMVAFLFSRKGSVSPPPKFLEDRLPRQWVENQKILKVPTRITSFSATTLTPRDGVDLHSIFLKCGNDHQTWIEKSTLKNFQISIQRPIDCLPLKFVIEGVPGASRPIQFALQGNNREILATTELIAGTVMLYESWWVVSDRALPELPWPL